MKLAINQRLLSRRLRLTAGAAAGLHLALAFCRPAHVPLPGEETSSFWHGVAVYAAAAGADNAFGFYAPSVGSDRKVVCLIYDAAAGGWSEAKLPKMNREANLRFGTMSSQSNREGEHDRIMDASWAAYCFGQMPGAEAVLVEHHVELMPTMAQFRVTGQRPAWMPYDIATFARSAGGVKAGDEATESPNPAADAVTANQQSTTAR